MKVHVWRTRLHLNLFEVNVAFTGIFHNVNGVFIVILIHALDHKIANS